MGEDNVPVVFVDVWSAMMLINVNIYMFDTDKIMCVLMCGEWRDNFRDVS